MYIHEASNLWHIPVTKIDEYIFTKSIRNHNSTSHIFFMTATISFLSKFSFTAQEGIFYTAICTAQLMHGFVRKCMHGLHTRVAFYAYDLYNIKHNLYIHMHNNNLHLH